MFLFPKQEKLNDVSTRHSFIIKHIQFKKDVYLLNTFNKQTKTKKANKVVLTI